MWAKTIGTSDVAACAARDRLVLEGDEQIDTLTPEGPCGAPGGLLVSLVPIVKEDVVPVRVTGASKAFAQGREGGWIVIEAHVEQADTRHPPQLQRLGR